MHKSTTKRTAFWRSRYFKPIFFIFTITLSVILIFWGVQHESSSIKTITDRLKDVAINIGSGLLVLAATYMLYEPILRTIERRNIQEAILCTV